MNTDLRASLADLRTSLKQLHRETEAVSARPLPNLSRLEQVILSLGQGEPKKPLLCPDEYLRQWREWLDRKRERLEWRVVRALCWEPEAATDMRFQNYLDRFWPDTYSSPLQGMIRACHLCWSPEFCQSDAARRVRQRLERYRGVNGLLLRWQNESALLLGSKGAEQFSEEIIRNQASVEAACQDWKLYEQTNYVAMAAEEAVRRCLNTPGLTSRAYETLPALLKWKNWPLEKFKRAVSEAILHKLAGIDGRYQQVLVNTLLSDSRLGDPRLQTVRWIGVQEEARRKLIQWLSREDIVFFFEHVLPKGGDKHKRKDFWLPYVTSMIQSRPLLDNRDKARLSLEIRKHRNFAAYGHAQNGISSFLLDFGSIVAVEFREAGAIYFYDASTFHIIVTDFWQAGGFNVKHLKRRDKALEYIRHIDGWQSEARSFLAKQGIRPT